MILFEAEDAYNLAQQGHFLTRAGYTYGNGVYFAFGTFPGCVRTGKIDLESFKGHQWILLSFEDLICRTGFYPTTSGSLYDFLKETPYADEALKHQSDMINYLVDSKFTSSDFRNPFMCDVIWKEFFAQGEERERNKCYPC